MPHLILDLVHEIVKLVVFEDVIVEWHLPKGISTAFLYAGTNDRVLRAANEKMHLHIVRRAGLDRRKVAQPATCLVP